LTKPDGSTESLTVITNSSGIVEGAFDIYVYGDYELKIQEVIADGILYNAELDIASSFQVKVTAVESEAAHATDRILDYFRSFNESFEQEDATFLIESIHPAAMDRYGDVCPAYLESIMENPVSIEVLEVTEFGPWIWVSDDLETSIENVYTIAVNYTVQGQTTPTEIHIALRDDASLGFFPDCGEPVVDN
jgi:hypothetical protein